MAKTKQSPAVPVAPISVKVRKLKDPLYGYVELSDLENVIMQHPLVLRLHYVRQNSSAYLTYPSAQGTRFAHSVGVMHLAGQLFSRALHAADDSVLEALEKQVAEVTGLDLKQFARSAAEPGEVGDLLSRDPFYRMYGLAPLSTPRDWVKLLLFQGMRLACLVHDIGHPPFSHVVENAFMHALPEEYNGHEDAGYRLIKSIISTNYNYWLGTTSLQIANELSKKGGAFAGLTPMVSGDVDADRVDYVRRDARIAGLTMSDYDIGRLVEASRLVVRNDRAETTFTTDALSAVEAFFVARFQLYRWMIWHHNVIRTDFCLERAMRLLMKSPAVDLVPAMLAERVAIRKRLDPGTMNEQYPAFHDGLLLSVLDRVLVSIREALKTQKFGSAANIEEMGRLERYLAVFLERRTERLVPLWKRVDQYRTFADQVLAAGLSGTRKEGELSTVFLNRILRDKFILKYSDSGPAKFTEDMERAILEAGTPKPVHAAYIAKFYPIPKGNYTLRAEAANEDLPLVDLSPIVAALESSWQGLPHLTLFCESDKGLVADKKLVSAAAAKGLATFLSQK